MALRSGISKGQVEWNILDFDGKKSLKKNSPRHFKCVSTKPECQVFCNIFLYKIHH